MFIAKIPLILASSSPRRKDLLNMLGLEFRIMPAPAESKPDAGETPEHYAARAAAEKAVCVQQMQTGDAAEYAILAADTIVVLHGKILGKPQDHAMALAMLRSLAGQEHTVITACHLLLGKLSEALLIKSKVQMWQMPDELLQSYAASAEPMDKAGAYAVQGQGAFMIRSINGSWANVVGLPVSEVTELLLKHHIIELK